MQQPHFIAVFRGGNARAEGQALKGEFCGALPDARNYGNICCLPNFTEHYELWYNALNYTIKTR